MKLRLRIILTFTLLMIIAFSCVIWLIISDVRPRYLESVEESAVETAELVAAMLSEQISEGRLPTETIAATMETLRKRTLSARIYSLHKRSVSLRIYVTDKNGILLYDSSGLALPGDDFSQWRDVYLTLKGRYGARSTRTIQGDPSSQVIFVAAPIFTNGEIAGVVSVGKPTNSVSFLIAIAQKRFFFSLALVGLAAIALSIGLSFWITRPVQHLTTYAKEIRQGKSKPLPRLGTSEMAELGSAMAEMQSKLEGKAYIEDYIRALTHELKSPITGIKGASEILHDHVSGEDGAKFLAIVETEADRLHSLVDRMLQLSRLENVRSVNKAKIALGPFLLSLRNSFQPQCAAGKIRLETTAPKHCVLEGDELLLRQAISNLVSNAIDFSPEESLITVSAAPEGQHIVITVRDQGAGMPEYALAKAFDKFFSLRRPDSGKKSTGLGLPFVAEVVALHEGTVTLANIGPQHLNKNTGSGPENTGTGLEVSIRLPL